MYSQKTTWVETKKKMNIEVIWIIQ